MLVLLIVAVIAAVNAQSQVLCGKYICVTIASGVFNVLQYGAKGDGKTLDTTAIQSAFNAAKSAKGGTVLFPSGYNFLSGPVSVESSNTAIVVEAGAQLTAMNVIKSWPTSSGAFIYGNYVSNLAIYGGGIVNGQGSVWWPTPDNFRPEMVYLGNAVNVLIANITFIDSPNHNLELYASYAELSNVTVLAPGDSPNTDAVDVHGSPFYVHDCYFSVGDDNIAQHVNDTIVEDCYFGTGHGASIGSIGDGLVQNVTFRNIVFNGTVNGARIKTDVGGVGYVRNITWGNIVAFDVQYMIYVTMYYATIPGTTDMHIYDITFRNITSYNSQYPGYFDCMPNLPCESFVMDQVQNLQTSGSFSCQNVFGTSTDVSPPSCFESS